MKYSSLEVCSVAISEGGEREAEVGAGCRNTVGRIGARELDGLDKTDVMVEIPLSSFADKLNSFIKSTEGYQIVSRSSLSNYRGCIGGSLVDNCHLVSRKCRGIGWEKDGVGYARYIGSQ